MKLVVTGALGHIGSRVIRELPLAFPGLHLVMIDNMATQRYPSLFDLPPDARYEFLEEDVLGMDLGRAMAGARAVIHLAAITNAAGSFEIKEKVEAENFKATQRVAEAGAAAGAAVFYVSSTSVYGTQAERVDEDCAECDLKPQSPYAETKLREERMLAEMAAGQGLRFIACRFGTIFGASPGMRFHTAVNKFCWQAVMGQPLTVWRTALHQKRPYLDLTDAVRAMSFVIDKDLFDGRTYNVLTLNTTVNQVVETIKAFAGEVKVEFVDTRIMNQLSYDVANERFMAHGFQFHGDMALAIGQTIRLLRGSRTV